MVLADVVEPYFDRRWHHYMSHLQAPSSGREAEPAVVQTGRVIYLSHPVSTQYETNAPWWVKRLLLEAIDRLLDQPMIRHDGPSTLGVSVLRQPSQGRAVVHLLHYIPHRRGEQFDTVDDVLPLYDIELSLRADEPVTDVRLQPQNESLKHEVADGRLRVLLPRVHRGSGGLASAATGRI